MNSSLLVFSLKAAPLTDLQSKQTANIRFKIKFFKKLCLIYILFQNHICLYSPEIEIKIKNGILVYINITVII